MVISENHKSYHRKTSAQISQKMGFGKDNATIVGLRKHILLIIAGLSHPFLGMGPGPLELGKIASFFN